MLIMLAQAAWAQQGAVGAGANAAGSGGSLSYSIGQVVYTAVQGAGGTSSQGIQQPYEYLILAVDAGAALESSISVAPNPTSDGVQLAFTGTPGTLQRYIVMDAAGKVLRTGNIASSAVQISMHDLPQATYLLRVEGDNDHVFQIIKQ